MTGIKYYAGRAAGILRYIFGDFRPAMRSLDYDAYWKERGPLVYSTRFDAIARLIEPGSSVLDLGCGSGACLKRLEDKLGVEGEGVDVSAASMAMCAALGVKASRADITAPSFRPARIYDYIVVSEVLEHIPDPEGLLARLRGNFTKGLVVTVPNTGYYLHRLRLLFGRFPVQWTTHPGEHLRFWTLKDFRSWTRHNGFAIVRMTTHTGFLFLHGLLPSLFADSIVCLLKEEAG